MAWSAMFFPHPQVDEERAGARARGAVVAPHYTRHPLGVLRIPPTDILGHLRNGDGRHVKAHAKPAQSNKKERSTQQGAAVADSLAR